VYRHWGQQYTDQYLREFDFPVQHPQVERRCASLEENQGTPADAERPKGGLGANWQLRRGTIKEPKITMAARQSSGF
jgi:hypothetical protein